VCAFHGISPFLSRSPRRFSIEIRKEGIELACWLPREPATGTLLRAHFVSLIWGSVVFCESAPLLLHNSQNAGATFHARYGMIPR